MAGEIYQLVYRSIYRAGRIDNTLQALRDIVRSSRRNNSKSGISGYLIFDRQTFLQILEGPHAEVVATYARIAEDPRHRETVTLQTRSVAERDFAAWAMGGVLRESAVPASLSGDEVIALAKTLMSSDSVIP